MFGEGQHVLFPVLVTFQLMPIKKEKQRLKSTILPLSRPSKRAYVTGEGSSTMFHQTSTVPSRGEATAFLPN